MSAPAQNSAGFGEARIIALIAGSASIASHALRERSAITSGETEFIGALSSHAIAYSPRVSSLTVAFS